jgi:hypothetical protein
MLRPACWLERLASPCRQLAPPTRPPVYGRACPSRGLPQPGSAMTTRPNHPLPRQDLHLQACQRPKAAQERRRAGLDQWLPLYLPFRASWQMAIRSCPRFLHPLGSFRTAGFPQYGWKPAWSSCTLPKPSPASFDAGLAFLSVSGSVSRRLGPRLYPQALGSARFIMPAPPNATTA